MISEKLAREMICDCQVHECYHDKIIDKWKGDGIIFEGDFNKLKHFYNTSIGLWATDKPEIIPDNIKDMFFELK